MSLRRPEPASVAFAVALAWTLSSLAPSFVRAGDKPVDCVQTRKQPVAPVEVAHRSITLAHLGNIALRTGRDLKWDPARETIAGDAGASEMLSRPYRKPWDKEWKRLLSSIPS